METLLIIFLIFIGQILGSLIGLVKRPKRSVLCGSLAFAASMMLGISFFQLVPESMGIAPFYLVAISFFGGIMMMWIVDKSLPHINPQLLRREKPSVERSVAMLVIGVALHNVPEGLAIAGGFASTPVLGIMIAFGVALHNIPENIATIVPLYALTKNRLKSFIITATTVLFELVSFIFGYYILSGIPSEFLGVSLAVAAGFMTYISIEELIPAAQIKQNFKEGLVGFILGLACVLLTSLIG